MSRKKNQDRELPWQLTAFDIPIPAKLVLAHAEQVHIGNPERPFSLTADRYLRQHLHYIGMQFHRLQKRLRTPGDRASCFKCWFFLDRDYDLRILFNAVEPESYRQVNGVHIVVRYPRAISAYRTGMIFIRSPEDAEKLGERSPIFAWLSMITCGQRDDETWAYFFDAS